MRRNRRGNASTQPPKSGLAPTGWRAIWRGCATIMAFAIRANPRLCAFLFAVETVSGLLWLSATYAAKLLVDAAVQRSLEGVLLAAAWIAVARVFGSLCGHQYVNSSIKLEEEAQHLLDRRLMEITGGMAGLEHLERPEYADELALLRGSRRSLGQFANAAVLNLRVAIQLGGATILLAGLHPLLVLLPLFGIPPLLAGKRATDIAQRVSEEIQERARIANHLFFRATSASAGKELRLFGLAGELFGRHGRLIHEMRGEHDRAEWQGTLLHMAGAAFFAVGYVVAVGLVLSRAVSGQATAGDVVLATALAGQVSGNVETAVQFGTYLLRVMRATGRYLWLAEYEAAARQAWTELAPIAPPERLVSGITLEGVSFTYPGTEKEILRDVSVHLPAGAVVALVGENGAGKTTLVKLLSRFYEPCTPPGSTASPGRILVDGVDLRRMVPEEWRARMSAAFQDFVRFELVLREAVGVGGLAALGLAEAETDSAVQQALSRAGAEDVPAGLPAGLGTQLGKSWEGGVELSGGQWQKLALGRAFMRQEPLLVVFDEPTAAIDAPTEHALFERFAAAARSGASRGTVTLIVSHRFSTVRMADLILVLEDGRIKEQGSHAELMALNGTYAELYGLQARAYR